MLYISLQAALAVLNSQVPTNKTEMCIWHQTNFPHGFACLPKLTVLAAVTDARADHARPHAKRSPPGGVTNFPANSPPVQSPLVVLLRFSQSSCISLQHSCMLQVTRALGHEMILSNLINLICSKVSSATTTVILVYLSSF